MPMPCTDFGGLCIQFQGKGFHSQPSGLIQKCPFTAAHIEHRLCTFVPAKLESESEFGPVAHIVISLLQFLIEFPGARERRIEKAKAAAAALKLSDLALGRQHTKC